MSSTCSSVPFFLRHNIKESQKIIYIYIYKQIWVKMMLSRHVFSLRLFCTDVFFTVFLRADVLNSFPLKRFNGSVWGKRQGDLAPLKKQIFFFLIFTSSKHLKGQLGPPHEWWKMCVTFLLIPGLPPSHWSVGIINRTERWRIKARHWEHPKTVSWPDDPV